MYKSVVQVDNQSVRSAVRFWQRIGKQLIPHGLVKFLWVTNEHIFVGIAILLSSLLPF